MPANPASRCFIDSNLWLYAMLPQQDQQREMSAKQLITTNRANIVISTQVVNEITNNLLRKGNFPEQAIRRTIRSMYHDLQIIPMSQTIQEQASELREKYSFSHYDGLIVAAALVSGAITLYSEDMHKWVGGGRPTYDCQSVCLLAISAAPTPAFRRREFHPNRPCQRGHFAAGNNNPTLRRRASLLAPLTRPNGR